MAAPQALRDAHKGGRLREELTDQAKRRTGRLQELWNKYGMVGIGTYFGVFVATLGSLYVVYDYGLVTELPSGAVTAIEKVVSPVTRTRIEFFPVEEAFSCRAPGDW